MRTVKVAPLKAWSIINNCGWLSLAVFSTRREAQDNFVSNWGQGATWKDLSKRMQAKAVKVTIVPDSPTAEFPDFKKRK